MASRWRIRHKLLLGSGLVVLVMALLLLGTLRALWSYYNTTNSIRARLAELIAAEELKVAIAGLTSAETTTRLENHPAKRDAEFRDVRHALDAYAEKLDATIALGHNHREGRYEKSVLEQLHRNLDDYRAAVGRELVTIQVGMARDEEMRQKNQEKLRDPARRLVYDASDLREHVKTELDLRLGESRRHYQMALWLVVPSTVVGLVVMAGLMRSFYAWVFNPIRDLIAGVSRVAQGDLDHRIQVTSGDEMEDLARAFNDMLGRLQELYHNLEQQVNERSRQLVRSERLASVGFLAAGVAHEINNPLASIAFCGEALEARLGELRQTARGKTLEQYDTFHKYLKMIQEEAFRCKSITERLLEFSRTGEPRRESTDLRNLIQAVLDVTQHLPNHKGKHIVFEAPNERMLNRVAAWVNGEEIKSVILNLVVNALESMDEGGKLFIRLGQRDGNAELAFRDTGCGMSRDVLENIFEPFFTRSRTGKGTGLGLTISHLIISQHGGAIEATSPGPSQGSTFTVRLPIQPREPVVKMTIGEGRAA